MHGDFAEPSVRQNQLLTMASRITHTNVHETRTDKSRCELRETFWQGPTGLYSLEIT